MDSLNTILFNIYPTQYYYYLRRISDWLRVFIEICYDVITYEAPSYDSDFDEDSD